MKIRGQKVEITLYEKPLYHLETPNSPNPRIAELTIEKKHKGPKVFIEIGCWTMRNGLRNYLIQRIRKLRSATIVHSLGSIQFTLKLNSGHPFVDDFLIELGKILEEGGFNLDLGPIQIIDKKGRPIHEAINEKIRTRKWIVTYGDKTSYLPEMFLASAEGLYMTRRQAMEKMKVVPIDDSQSDIGTYFVCFLDPQQQVRAKRFAPKLKKLVLVEVTE